MVIKNVSCDQFAGIKDKDITFSDGINVIVGKNETGKSTIVDLMYQLFFEPSKVLRNKPFLDLYFPRKASGVRGDFINGCIIFKTPEGQFRLTKEWEVGGGACRLTLPDATMIRDENTIKEILERQLKYGRGVYDEMVFPSQKRETHILKSLFMPSDVQKKTEDPTMNAKNEISSVIMKAVMETGGVSVNELEKKLKNTLLRYDEHWDADADMPEGGVKRGIHNKWAIATTAKAKQDNTAILLRAYYDREETADRLANAIRAENEIEEAYNNLSLAKEDLQKALNQKERFLKFRGILKSRELIEKSIKTEKLKLTDLDRDKKAWPEAEKKRDAAAQLQKKLAQSRSKELYEKVKQQKDLLSQKKNEAEKLGEVSAEDIKAAVNLEKEVREKSASLRGLNLTAKIKQLSDKEVNVNSAVSGKELTAHDGAFQITEAVNITVPGVIEMQIMPNGIDAQAISEELKECEKKLREIREKYSVADADELKEKNSRAERLAKEISDISAKIMDVLDGCDFSELEKEYSLLPRDVAASSDIEREIRSVCGSSSVDAFIGLQEGILKTLEEKYESPKKLDDRITECEESIEKNTREAETIGDVPAEFKAVADIDGYETILSGDVEKFSGKVEFLRGIYDDKQKSAESKSAEEYQELLTEKQEYFNRQKEEYAHWKHIAEVVAEQKAKILSNPMEDIEERFNKYLNVMTDGKVALSEINEKLDASLTSGNNQMDYEILSEGTKDTISLAFRLAVLEHLFPEGGGLAVFDDPFTDMDEDRKDAACRLLKEYAKNNQIIFVTCDDEYAKKLNGNLLKIGK